MRRRALDPFSPIRDALLASLALGLGCTSHEGGQDKQPPIVEPPPPKPMPAVGVCGAEDPNGERAKDIGGGHIRCADGSINRIAEVTPRPHPSKPLPKKPGDQQRRVECTSDADCEGDSGRCLESQGQIPGYYCHEECLKDADCPAGRVCIAREAIEAAGEPARLNMCVEASCLTGSDCESKECALTAYNNGCGTAVSLTCRSDADQCRSNDDCENQRHRCAPSRNQNDALACENRFNCAIGRPFMIEGSARMAPTRRDSAWVGDQRPNTEGLSPELRSDLARWWTRIAQLEHASIASFSRFTLQLLELGAPPELLLESQQAGLDELEHARIAFAMASAYGGAALGPDRLPLEGAMQGGLEAFVDALIDEGCIGESTAAAMARAQAAVSVDPAVGRVLSRIAEDETRHAALAWKTLRWLTETHGAWVLERAATRIRDELDGPVEPAPALDPVAPPTAQQERSLRRAAIEALVWPLLVALRDDTGNLAPTVSSAPLHS